jgi:3-(3-hydroxy-phenyl)propionate hydroxylase
LPGDAAHVNNPLGGLGLNFGIHDAIELSRLLGRALRGTSVDILDLYDRHRRPLNVEFVQQQTVANKKRMEEKDPVTRARNFDEIAATAADPVAHRAYLLRASLLDSVKDRAEAAA